MPKIDVEHLSRLAQIGLEGEELSELYENLDQIMRMVDQMREIDTTEVEPLAHPLDANQQLRSDVQTEEIDRELNQAMAPLIEDGFYIVPRVVD
ncbi:MAG: Asp-tRNA(Asn)/Glu-tRNA(Gln) amidotransferase GatCAB subunit C [Gammaproteobacteria bacterium]|nr:Asp-tRNA(Asn)/Glu-tRNA(Gln) amidotransferase GatCAB subunit C [Gammaproteobacteria bacterium]|tara:strand:- start:2 stop:283 length:282 start_codon:yes stop_codon:yes gene_type:complete